MDCGKKAKLSQDEEETPHGASVCSLQRMSKSAGLYTIERQQVCLGFPERQVLVTSTQFCTIWCGMVLRVVFENAFVGKFIGILWG